MCLCVCVCACLCVCVEEIEGVTLLGMDRNTLTGLSSGQEGPCGLKALCVPLPPLPISLHLMRGFRESFRQGGLYFLLSGSCSLALANAPEPTGLLSNGGPREWRAASWPPEPHASPAAPPQAVPSASKTPLPRGPDHPALPRWPAAKEPSRARS